MRMDGGTAGFKGSCGVLNTFPQDILLEAVRPSAIAPGATSTAAHRVDRARFVVGRLPHCQCYQVTRFLSYKSPLLDATALHKVRFGRKGQCHRQPTDLTGMDSASRRGCATLEPRRRRRVPHAGRSPRRAQCACLHVPVCSAAGPAPIRSWRPNRAIRFGLPLDGLSSGALAEKLSVEDLIAALRQSTVLGSTVVPVIKHVWTDQVGWRVL